MKNRLLYIIVLAITSLLFSCEENNDGFYDNISRIYFPKETDSLNFSFGDKVPEYDKHIIYVPVKLIGMKTTKDLKFQVALNKELSSAKENEHFTALQTEYTFLADSINAYIPIELLRNKLSEEEVDYKIVLDLLPNDDFVLGSKENLRAVVTYNNYLEKPDWWDAMLSAYTVNYHRGMYQRIIAYYGHPIDMKFVSENYLKFMLVFKREVYDYAQEHPELTADWEFFPEEGLWWPFE